MFDGDILQYSPLQLFMQPAGTLSYTV